MSLMRFKNKLSLREIEQMVRAPIMKRKTRFYLLRHDDTIVQEITNWVSPGGNLEKTDGSGQVRSTSISLQNEKISKVVGYKNGVPVKKEKFIWTPSMNGTLGVYEKLKIVTEIYFGNEIYQIDEGIFVICNPSLNYSNAENIVELQCYDKFALLDGTIDGTDDLDYEIPVSTPLWQALEGLVRLERAKGIPFDIKPIVFPVKYKNELTPYTLKKDSGSSIGEIITDLCNMISCDVKYSDEGLLTVKDGLSDLDYHHRSVSWNFRENETKNPTLAIDRSKIKNKVTVVGTNINGRLCKGEAENDNPQSNYNTSIFGSKPIKITDDLIYTNLMCKERAKYELKKYAQNYITLTFSCNYIPHLEPGDIVRWSYEPWDIENEEFLVNSISIPLQGSEMMSLSCTNLKELPLY